jgi:hypothetical protein
MAGEAEKPRRESKYAHLLESDPTFKAWYFSLLRASQNTGAGYFLRMGRLRDEVFHITPTQMATLDRTELMTFISNAVSDLDEKGVKGGTIDSYVKAIAEQYD